MSPTTTFRDGSMSPRQESVCSDSEVPYISYTVSKPIGGDSPKKKPGYKYRFTSPNLGKRSVSMDPGSSSKGFVAGRSDHKKSIHDTLVVVNRQVSDAKKRLRYVYIYKTSRFSNAAISQLFFSHNFCTFADPSKRHYCQQAQKAS